MKLSTNGITLNVEVRGEGEPVLLLHGFPDSWRLWHHQMTALADAGYRAIAPDLRGHGDSDKPEGVEHYSLLNVLGDLTGLLDELDVERAHVVGHDWGAATGWVFASLHPDRTATLTALSTGHVNSLQRAGMQQYRLSWYIFMFQFEGVAEEWLSRNDWAFLRSWFRGDELTEERIQRLSQPGALTAGLNWYRANIPPRSWLLDPYPLPPIEAPTLAIWSSEDGALTERQMTQSEQYVTGPWRYERLDGVGHWIPLEVPDKLNALMQEFLRAYPMQ